MERNSYAPNGLNPLYNVEPLLIGQTPCRTGNEADGLNPLYNVEPLLMDEGAQRIMFIGDGSLNPLYNVEPLLIGQPGMMESKS